MATSYRLQTKLKKLVEHSNEDFLFAGEQYKPKNMNDHDNSFNVSVTKPPRIDG